MTTSHMYKYSLYLLSLQFISLLVPVVSHLILFYILTIRPNKKQLFSVPDPTLIYWWNLEFFSGFLEENIILCILKGETPFKMHKTIYMCTYPT